MPIDGNRRARRMQQCEDALGGTAKTPTIQSSAGIAAAAWMSAGRTLMADSARGSSTSGRVESAYWRWVEPWHARCIDCRGHMPIDGESADHFVGRMATHSCLGR